MEADIILLAAGANAVDKTVMARKPLPPSDLALAVIAALAMLMVAIIVRTFWLSLILGIIGAATFAYVLFRLREHQKSLPGEDKGAS